MLSISLRSDSVQLACFNSLGYGVNLLRLYFCGGLMLNESVLCSLYRIRLYVKYSRVTSEASTHSAISTPEKKKSGPGWGATVSGWVRDRWYWFWIVI